METLKQNWKRYLVVLAILAIPLMAIACGSNTGIGGEKFAVTKGTIKFHDGQWETLSLHNALAMYITEHGYGYPVEEIEGTTGTMKVALPLGDLDVNMEMWRQNISEWYEEQIALGKLTDLAGTTDNVEDGAKGQILESSIQAFYIPTYIAEENPGLKSVSDLPDYWELFKDQEDPSKGVMVNCIIGWQCQKIVRAKWHAYGLYDTYNVMEPGAAAAIDANMKGAYDAKKPVLTYYWEPTKLLNDLDMTRLEEPEWTQKCQDALDAAVEAEPYESTEGCGFPIGDVHTGVNNYLFERAPEVVTFLGNIFVGALALDDLTTWRKDNEKDFDEAAIYYLKNNEATWTKWVPTDIADKVKAALAS